MAKINSKEKGKRFERELASLLREYGYEARRTAQYCGKSEESADVVGLPFIHIEAKHQEKMELYKWMEQAKRDAEGTENMPAVFHKKNRADILVTVRIEDFLKIYKAFWSCNSPKTTKMEKDEKEIQGNGNNQG